MSGSQLALLGGPFGGPAAAGDPNWQNVTLLSGTTSTNAGQNNTFLDSSTNNFTVTRNGNATQGSFSPFIQTNGYWSNYFDGSGDYISLPNSSISLGSGNCAVEFWCYITGEPSSNPFLFDNFGNSSARLYAYYDGSTMYLNADGNTRTTTFAYNTWNFFQFTRSSGTGGWYLNGTLIGTTFSTTGTIDLQRMTIGAAEESGTANPSQWYQGYISNFRASNTNRSTSVPTTPFSSDANAVVLTCQSNRFIDNSPSPLTITRTGDVTVQPFQPFGAPIVPYSASTLGGSGFFTRASGVISNLSLSPTGLSSMSTWTMEFWAYNTGSGDQAILGPWTPNLIRDTGSQGNLEFYLASNFIVSSTAYRKGQWNHVALSNASGGNLSIYINGARVSLTSAVTINLSSMVIGSEQTTSSLGDVWNGYVSDFRVLNGTALYSGTTITVPTAPLTAITNTAILLSFINFNIYDQAADNDMETAGNAQVSTSVKKYGNSSMAFDGSGDYLAMPNSPNFDMGSGEFTIEGWMYQTSSTGSQAICAKYEASFQASWYIGTSSTNWDVYVYYGASSNLTVYTGAAPSLNTWNHFALVRCSDRILFYVNGNQLASVASQTMRTTTSGVSIGRTGAGYTDYFYGYISDLRITKGLARYPYNFTPPTTSLPNFYQAQTLTADPYFEYTTLLLPGSGTNGAQNNTFLDSSTNAFSITRNGNTTQGTFSPFSQTGWGNYFPGGGAYLSLPNNSNLAWGSGTFTFEFWFYNMTDAANQAIYDTRQTGLNPANEVFILLTSGNEIRLSENNTARLESIGVAAAPYKWVHVAIERNSSNVITLYINGVSNATWSSTNTFVLGNAPRIGRTVNDSISYNGYISNMRLVKGSAVYNGAFTPPTSPLTAITNTQLLTCQSNRFIDNSSNSFSITVTGTPSVQAFSPFAPTAAYSAATNGGSGYFDGTGDYLTITNNAAFEPNTYVSLECWVYFNSLSADRLIVGRQGMWINYSYTAIGTTSNKIGFGIYNGSTWYMASGTTTITTNQWYHVVGVRDSGTLRIYINGVQEGTASFVGSPASFSTAFAIGASFDGTQPITGYLSGIRYCNGSTSGALPYTGSSFTVPTSPPTNTTDTKILANFTNAGITDATAKNDFETVGNAQISNGQAKWGSTSIYFDGSGGDAILTPMSPNLQLLGQDWTIEYWLYANSWFTGDIMGSFKSGAYCWIIQMNGSGVTMYNTLSTTYSFSTTLSTGQWYHVALSNYGLRLRCFINGTQIGSTQTITAFPTATRPLYIGYNEDNGAGAAGYNGYLQDVRITTGIARYTQNFTPPTAAFQLL